MFLRTKDRYKVNKTKIDMNTKKYFIYCRQAIICQDNTQSVRNQEDILKQYAYKNDLNLVDIFSDIGSGFTQFEEMLDAIHDGQANSILVTDLSRLSRNRYCVERLADYLNHGIIRTIDTWPATYGDDLCKKLYFAIMSGVSELEKGIVGKRTKEGMMASKLRKSQN